MHLVNDTGITQSDAQVLKYAYGACVCAYFMCPLTLVFVCEDCQPLNKAVD